MKKSLYLLLLLFPVLFTNCEDVIEVETPTEPPRLVIDATFNYYSFISNPQLTGGIKLSLTAPFFQDEIPPVNNAQVSITNLSSNEVISFNLDPNKDGKYTGDFLPEFNIEYELMVIYDGETYTSIQQLIPVVPIDSIVQGDGTLFEGDETEMIISFTDDGSRTDFYLFDLDYAMFLASEDTFYQGNPFSFSYFYEDLVPGQEVTISILGIDEQHYNYINQIIAQAGDDSQGPFQTPAALVKGNLVNQTKKENFPLGYFRISQADRFSITVK